jgi:hypothetical protein
LRADDSSSSVLLTLSADRYAVCAGAVHNDVHQAHLVACVTDLEGRPLAGQVVTFSADHEFKFIGPWFDPPVAITDADGEARTVLTSGDGVVQGQLTARCEGAESTVPMDFEAVDMDVIESDMGAGGRVDAHETWHGQPVAGHYITWRMVVWLMTNPDAFGKDETADYRGLGKPPFGSLSPGGGITDDQGLTTTVYTAGTIKDHLRMWATDRSVWTE